MENETGTTPLRDTIEQAFDQVVETPETVEVKTDAAPEEKAGRTAGRPRDEQGRLLPGKAEPKDAEIAAPVRERPKYPSTWKKDFEPKWQTIDHDLAEEISRRESDYAKGVSTYKTEYDRVKPIDEVLKPYQPFFQQTGMKPEQYVSQLAQVDHQLRSGTKEQKLKLFADLAKSNDIPVHELFIQGEDGKIYWNQQQQQAQHQGMTPQEVQQMVQQQMAQVQIQAAVQQFRTATDTSGNPLYPHFETVKATMDGLLRAGLAQDLQTAYKAALSMPQHSELVQSELATKQEADRLAELKAKAEAAMRAKAGHVSVKSQSPTGEVSKGTKERKGLRDTINDAFEAHTGSGRV